MEFRIRKEKRAKGDRERCKYSWNVANNAPWVKENFKVTA